MYKHKPYKKQNNSISHQHAVKGYLRPALSARFERYLNDNDITMSEALNRAVKLMVMGREDF